MVRKVYLFLSHPEMAVEPLQLHPLGLVCWEWPEDAASVCLVCFSATYFNADRRPT